ncbi:MAG TPA: hypothetical protein VFX47_00810 [Gammaproteobacteria bacterium]|nr:hypothetical protein [Gammaproteobacteria bacterium]
MSVFLQRYAPGIAAIGFVILLLPPMMRSLESSMSAQMLVQIPLLAAVGWFLRGIVPRRLTIALESWNYNGIAGLILAALAVAFWMLPRSLDAAVTDPMVATAKFVSVPLLIGLPLGLSWPRMGFVIRGVFLAELVAMCFRLGWLYLISPIRLCSNYLLDDQQRSGKYLLLIGAAIFMWLAIKLLWGRFESLSGDPPH